MPTALQSEWTDCPKAFPYRDHLGRWQWPVHTQRRKVLDGGKFRWEYRERGETDEEWSDRQW